ncbi:unnamed protein product [Phytophthora lilii]|uniref:Unnamed protein product n=1 Tax=Phytophthora lilii TaxID=2077276 RepID=A0A9W6WUI0_9STRA|nr:unnamed protein product [Phytophthora lilii]
MLDLLSPLRGYIAQSLQFYLSKYIEDIQLEGLGLFGGDLVLNDLEIKRHVLRESLELPASFDFSRGFLRELRIHIPWTQLLSQPIEVKLYTVELILTAKRHEEGRRAAPEPAEDKIEQPKSGWLHDTLQKILANVSVQVNNLVLNDGETKNGAAQDQVRRKVLGYEVPVLSRTSASVRAKLQLFSKGAVGAQDGRRSRPTSPRSPSHQQPLRPDDEKNIIDMDGLFGYRPSVMCDPFYYYSCNRSSVTPMYEMDIFIGELLFSVSDRQLEMLNQLIRSTSRRMDQAQEAPLRGKYTNDVTSSFTTGIKMTPKQVPSIPATAPQKKNRDEQHAVDSAAKKRESWFGWAISALGTTEDEEEDELVSELLAETRGALLKAQPPTSSADEDIFLANEPVMKTSCVRMCISSASLMLRKHEKEEQESENQDSTVTESGEDLVPVANLGMVKVSRQTRKRKVARPAKPILNLTLSYVALEMLLARDDEQGGTDMVFEIEKVGLVSATTCENREDSNYTKEQVLLTWGSIDSSHFSDCVSHPYFINSFFGEETTRLNQRETRSFEIVKVSLDADIPVWKTLEVGRSTSDENLSAACECSTVWDGKPVPCIPISTVSEICQQAIKTIGIKERVLDGGILSNVVSTAWATNGFPISVSEEMARAFTSTAEEYRAHRNPDLGALDNLTQLLQPQLIALLCRYSLHSCSAASFYSSSGSSSIRHRSIHSALRLRLATTTILADCDESPDMKTRKQMISKVLDISVGMAEAILEPPHCVEIAEAVSTILHGDGEVDSKPGGANNGVSMSASQEEPPSLQWVMQSDVKLVTLSTVHLHVPGLPTSLKQDVAAVGSCGGLEVVVRDIVWLGTFRPGNSKSCLQFGSGSIHLEKDAKKSAVFREAPLIGVLGVELLITESTADGGDSDGLSVNLDKLMIGLSLSATQDVLEVVDGIGKPFGHPVAWQSRDFVTNAPRSFFQVEMCKVACSRVVTNRPRLVMAQCQSLTAEIASISVSVRRTSNKNEVGRCILQGGIVPITMRKSNVDTPPLFKFSVIQEKSAGVLIAVPLLGSVTLFSMNPGLIASTSRNCHFAIDLAFARLFVELEGVFQLLVAIQNIVEGVRTSLPVPKDSSLSQAKSEENVDIVDFSSEKPTDWALSIHLEVAGGEICLNNALLLNIPHVVLSSTNPETHLRNGGAVKITCNMQDITLTVSGNGVLKELADPELLSVRGISASIDFAHRFDDHMQTYAIDGSLHVSSIEASLSRLKVRTGYIDCNSPFSVFLYLQYCFVVDCKLMYLLKSPFSKSKPQRGRGSPNLATSFPQKAKNDVFGHKRWHLRLGGQVNHFGLTCSSDIVNRAGYQHRSVRVTVLGQLSDVCVATRIGNHHPVSNTPSKRNILTDIQVSVGNIHAVEKLRPDRRKRRNMFGDFSQLPEHAFLGILVCLGLPELASLSETLRVSNPDTSHSSSLPPAMLSWHLTSNIAKAFQGLNVGWPSKEGAENLSQIEVPLVSAGNDPELAKSTHFPLVSVFLRNYNEAGLPHHVVAGSVEDVDIALTTSSLYCLASVLAACNVVAKKGSSSNNADFPNDAPDPQVFQDSLANVEVSFLLGQLRLILPSEALMDSVILKRPGVAGNMCIVLESLSVMSAVRNEISLEGLGYPPFNSRILPRRSNVQAQRFGQSQVRLGCKAGKISGYVAELVFDHGTDAPSSASNVPGVFEEHIGRSIGTPVRFSNVETFWSPFNITCSVDEESVQNNGGESSSVKTSATIALTKLRIDLHKATFDVLATRLQGVTRGLHALRTSVVSQSNARLTPITESKSRKKTNVLKQMNQREVVFSCDGIDFSMFEANTSTHIRFGSIVLSHNISALSGSASIQNVVVGYRPNDGPTSPRLKTISSEEVVFGANAEPSLWQLGAETYPEKLIAARWDFRESTEGTLFIDVQPYQLHVSHHFILAMSRFATSNPDLIFSIDFWGKQRRQRNVQEVEPIPFTFKPRWNIKVLIAPSVMSFWVQNRKKSGASSVWVTSGQIFASVGVGSEETTQLSLRTGVQEISDITRFVAVPTLEMMLNVDKFGINTSDDMPPLVVNFQRSSVGSAPAHTTSSWQRFSKYINAVSEAQRLVHECSVRTTGDQQHMLERVDLGDAAFCLIYTDIARTSIQVEVNALCVKLSSLSLGAIQSLIAVLTTRENRNVCVPLDSQDYGVTVLDKNNAAKHLCGTSTDDFKMLKRIAEGRRPLPGELVFTESLLIETQSVISTRASVPIALTKVQIQVDPNNYDIGLADVGAFLEDCNGPWKLEEENSNTERAGLGNKTHSWMGMRWCYHIPRSICHIIANPVPIPPTGVPNGWPSWDWDQDHESVTRRLCDILCQLRCWDSKKACYILVCEFYVPWERLPVHGDSEAVNEAYEPGSFGELMSQWFDDDMEETQYRSKLVEFGARARTFTFDTRLSSDNWELRWRSPLQSEQESENKQKRLVVNALLASSLQISSTLDSNAYQRVVANVTLPQVTMSVSHVGATNDSHDIITTELTDVALFCAVSGNSDAERALDVRVSSAVQVYLDNMVQLLTVSVVPKTTVDAMIESTFSGLKISTLVGPVSFYLNQTSMLVLSAIPKLLQSNPCSPKLVVASPDENLSSMRIQLVNDTGVDIWYRQEGTSECLLLPLNASVSYSWLSLACSPFYQLSFAVEDPSKQQAHKTFENGKKHSKGGPESSEDPRWCDPCRIKENYVTGRYFVGHGFLWICVELKGLQTVVTLRPPLVFRNFCDFPVQVKVNEAFEYGCARSDELYQDHHISQQEVLCSHSNCISVDGSACTIAPSTKTYDSVLPIMVESVSRIDFGIDGSWCSLIAQKSIPSEFDLVKISDGQPDGPRKAQNSFSVFRHGNCDEPVQYAWAKVCRAQCRAVLPTDFDPLQPQISRRYTWMDVSLWPAISLENSMDIPFKALDNDRKEHIFDFVECKVIATICADHHPLVKIRTERVLTVANMSPNELHVSIGSPLGKPGTIEKLASCVEKSVGFSVVSNRLMISIATNEDRTNESSHIEWSPEISLNVKGETKSVVVPPRASGLSTLVDTYCVELTNSDGYLKLVIRPQVVVINATVSCNIYVLPFNSSNLLRICNNEGWSVPVCLHKEAKKRSITADMSSWLSSKLSRRPSEDLSNAAKQALVARLSCSFRVCLAEDGYEWTEEIAVLLPKIPLQLHPDGKLDIVEPSTSSSASPNSHDGLYPAPSTTTHRRRLLLRHQGYRHKMLTYTMTQKGKSIHVMFFVDHQSPVIIHNQWQRALGFRNLSFPSEPEGVGADYYLEYDWALQVSAKQYESPREEDSSKESREPVSAIKIFTKWLNASRQSTENGDVPNTTSRDRIRFQVGSPKYGWSNALWQVGGIQFASFRNDEGDSQSAPTFLVMCFYRAGSWLISISCLEDPLQDARSSVPPPPLVLPSMATPTKIKEAPPSFLKIGVVVEELSFHFCDEHDPMRDTREMILYPEILRATCSTISIVFATSPDPPEVSRHSSRLGYLSHVRSYTTLFVVVEDIEVGHFLQTCNFPVMLCFPETHASKDLSRFDRVKRHEGLVSLMGNLLGKQLPGVENASFSTRVVYTDTWDPVGIPSYFHSIELKIAPAVLQTESRSREEEWSLFAYESAAVTKQRKVFIERLEISNLQVTITARVSIPVLNSFDGTPLHFGSMEMRDVFSFPDQLYKDLAADYVADTIVRSPMLLMSLNIIGNPAGFVRSFGQGIRDLIEIPLAASRNGYSPWILTKGVVGGVASFLGHTTAATLTSVSGFSYSISRTMDQLTLPSEQLKKRHYTRSTQLSSALADGLGSLGSSVVGAATGVITTPIAVYKERQMQGLDTGIRNVVGGVGMGLVGIVARPMGGVASLVSIASDGLLYGMRGTRTPFDDGASRFDAKPNELLRYKLKVLPDAIGSNLIFAHGIWIVTEGNELLYGQEKLEYISESQLEDPIRSLLLRSDMEFHLVQVTVVCSNECLYVVGVSGAQSQAVLVRMSLESIQAVEESLKEPTVIDLGIKASERAEWLRFRLPARQRRHLSHQLRLWLANM